MSTRLANVEKADSTKTGKGGKAQILRGRMSLVSTQMETMRDMSAMRVGVKGSPTKKNVSTRWHRGVLML